MEFRWPWADDGQDRFEERILRRLDHISARDLRIEMFLVRVLELLESPVEDPVSVTLIPGALMPVTLNPGQTVTYSYTEQNADGTNVDVIVGTPAFSTPDANLATVVDNGDGTATVTAVAVGTSELGLTVTFADAVQVSTTDAVTIEAAVVDPTAVTLVPGTPV